MYKFQRYTLFLALLLMPSLARADLALPGDIFKSIVTINSYLEDEDGLLTRYAQGSGVVIDGQGLLLTNRHVVVAEDNLDDSELESVYQICMPETIEAEPDCFYTAQFIAADKNLDAALLRFQPIPGLGRKAPYRSIAWNTAALPNGNEMVTTFGYPEIGGATLTVGQGTITGRIEKYGKTWFKIDAVSSFGSSGGATIDAKGNLIGIITAAHSDYAGSLGYVMSAATLAPWVNAHRELPLKTSRLIKRLEILSKLKHDLKTSDTYRHTSPPFSIAKPSSWKFKKIDENQIALTDENDPEGGFIFLASSKFPGNLNLDTFIENLKNGWAIDGSLPFTEIIKTTPLAVQGAKAYRLRISSRGSIDNMIVFFSGEYFVLAGYSYGKNEKDQVLIDNLVRSIIFDKPLPVSSLVRRYSHSKEPKFNLTIKGSWLAKPLKSSSGPLLLWHRNIKNAKIEVALIKTDENNRDMNNDEYIAHEERMLEQLQKKFEGKGFVMRIVKTNPHYKLNKQIQNVVVIDYTKTKEGRAQKPFLYERDYVIKDNERFLIFSLYIASSDQKVQATVLKDFDQLMSTLRIQ